MSDDRQLKWDLRYLSIAFQVGAWSKDPSTKVGAVLVRNNRMIAEGFNGFPAGEDDAPALYADRSYKYAHVIHAEDNCLNSVRPEDVRGATLYTSFPCCPRCTRLARSLGIARIVCPELQLFVRGKPTDWVIQWSSWVAESLYVAHVAGIKMELLKT